MTGSHTNAMAALDAGRVDAACASYSSFEKAVANGQIDPKEIIPLAKSDPIPYPPMAMHVKLDESLKKTLRKAFNNVHNAEGMTPDMIRGYGGKKIDRYNADFSEAEFDKAMSKLAVVTDELKSEIIKKASDQ
jgi:phosphonate transport system substrate-binding protein